MYLAPILTVPADKSLCALAGVLNINNKIAILLKNKGPLPSLCVVKMSMRYKSHTATCAGNWSNAGAKSKRLYLSMSITSPMHTCFSRLLHFTE